MLNFTVSFGGIVEVRADRGPVEDMIEIGVFAGAGWTTLSSSRERWRMVGKAFKLQWTNSGCCC